MARDPYAIVGVEYVKATKTIRVKLATQFRGTPFEDVAVHLKRICERIQPNVIAIESNNMGTQAIEYAESAGLRVQPVRTVSTMSEANRTTLLTMDKTFTVNYMVQKINNGLLMVPHEHSPHIRELITQMKLITKHTTPSGQITYRAQKNRHDDLFMALLLCCHVVRVLFEAEPDEGSGNRVQ